MDDQSPQSGPAKLASEPSAADAGTPQKPLFVEEAEQREAKVGRLFLPTNREDALLLLAGLCISAHLPDPNVRLAVEDGTPTLVADGVRSSEEELLRDGQTGRFPVLIEIAPDREGLRPAVIGFDQIVRLVFRSQDEADAFRFRPVDEFDPESLDFRVEPGCFALEGEPRFALRHGACADDTRLGHLADRLTCALHYVSMLGEARAECRNAVLQFVAAPSDQESGDPTLASIFRVLTGEVAPPAARQLSAVVQAFIEAESASAGELVDDIASRLLAVEPSESRTRDTEVKWAAIAREVARNKVALDGDLLSDEKSVLLRGALLALVPDTIEQVSAFLEAEKPAGVRVATFAAFLIGLKQGILNMPWSQKGPHARQLAGICRLLTEAGCRAPMRFDGIISASILEHADSITRHIAAESIQLANWTSPKVQPRDPIEDDWMADFSRLGYQVQSPGRTERSWMVNLSGGPPVEIRHCAIAAYRFPVLRHRLDQGEKLRKPREISAAFASSGHLWFPRADEDGVLCLCCELHVLPALAETGLIVAALEAARSLCIAPTKPARKRTVKSAETKHQP